MPMGRNWGYPGSMLSHKILIFASSSNLNGATYAITKLKPRFQSRIPKELDKSFDIPRVSLIHWIFSNDRRSQIPMNKKVMAIFNPGIQPTHATTKTCKQIIFLTAKVKPLSIFIWVTQWYFIKNRINIGSIIIGT